jgi:NAD(P)-dependent dehydrogenase (short-subunit alcohol dehydrogenase family)
VDVVCLNAGVFAGGHAWETTDDDWDWVLGVNLRGVTNGIRSFVPGLIAAATPAHVLVTASIAGVVAAPTSAVYCTSKFAAVGLAECLHHDLVLVGADHVAVSVVCPGMVRTNIGKGDRNRPAHLGDATVTDATALAAAGIEDAMGRGIDPLDGGRNAVAQVLAGRFYASTQPVEFWERLVGAENEDRLAGRPPRFQMYE